MSRGSAPSSVAIMPIANFTGQLHRPDYASATASVVLDDDGHRRADLGCVSRQLNRVFVLDVGQFNVCRILTGAQLEDLGSRSLAEAAARAERPLHANLDTHSRSLFSRASVSQLCR